MSEIEVPDRPCSLNRRLAPSSSRERISRPAERVARTACLGSPAGGSEAVGTDLGAILPSPLSLYDIQTNMSTGPPGATGQPARMQRQTLHERLPARSKS